MIATTRDLYCLVETASNAVGQATYEVQRAEYLRTHRTSRRFRFTPTPAHQFLIVLLGTSQIDAHGLHDLVTSYQSYVLMHGAPLSVSRIFSTLIRELASLADHDQTVAAIPVSI